MTATLSRRHAMRLLALAAAAVLPGARAASFCPAMPKPVSLIKPARLQAGDLVGLIAPGGYTTDAAIEHAVGNITALGFRAAPGANLRAVHGNYAGTVAQRLADLHAMFANPEIKALWCIRGGSGAISLLAHIDYALVRANPKILLGYSDITALHLALHRHAGLVSFHGPVASSTLSDYAVEQLRAVLCEPRARTTIPMSSANALRALSEPVYRMQTVHAGVATGRLMGGNLSLVSALAGTPYAADFRDAILFLEEVNEAPYRIDRWLTQLDLSAGLRHAAAVMIGVCENCGPDHEPQSLTLDETLALHLDPLTAPAVTGYSFGHIRNQFTIPYGIRATLDTAQQTLTLLEPAVT